MVISDWAIIMLTVTSVGTKIHTKKSDLSKCVTELKRHKIIIISSSSECYFCCKMVLNNNFSLFNLKKNTY